jgi:transposase
MEILATYDLTRSYRATAQVCGVSHNTVRAYVKARDEGRGAPAPRRVGRKTDPFEEQIRSWVKQSRGIIRADVVHGRLLPLGYTGSERTTRSVVAAIKEEYRLQHTRVHRPWVPEPGLWLQYDFGDGPVVAGARTVLFCAWLAFSRFRIVIALRDRTAPSVFSALDRAFRLIGGVPTYVLTDNEKLVTTEHVAGLPVRNPQAVAFSRHYSTVVHTCLPADPATKGGVENAVRVSKADLVPTDANLLPAYGSFAELEKACTAFMEEVNSRVHRATLEIPAQMLKVIEAPRLHAVPAEPFVMAFGQVRRVPPQTPMVTFENARYSVPHQLLGQSVWVRDTGEQIVIVHAGAGGPVEVARHARTRPGVPAVNDAHFPPTPAGALAREPRPASAAEKAFLDIGEGARLWLKEASAAGTQKIRSKMDRAVHLAKLLGAGPVDQGLGAAAVHHRFNHEDLVSIIEATATGEPAAGLRTVTDPGRWLSQGTGGWAGFGTTGTDPDVNELEGDTNAR